MDKRKKNISVVALQTTGALKDTFVVFYAWVDMLPTITPKGNVCVLFFQM